MFEGKEQWLTLVESEVFEGILRFDGRKLEEVSHHHQLQPTEVAWRRASLPVWATLLKIFKHQTALDNDPRARGANLKNPQALASEVQRSIVDPIVAEMSRTESAWSRMQISEPKHRTVMHSGGREQNAQAFFKIFRVFTVLNNVKVPSMIKTVVT
eukprot:Gb_25282 [translate_table: standard]